MKKKILYISISILIVLVSANTINKKYIKENNKEVNNKSLAVYIENDNGEFNKTNSIPLKDSGYTLNTSKSVCEGNTNLSWNNDVWGLELSNIDRENTKCYLYFDKN